MGGGIKDGAMTAEKARAIAAAPWAYASADITAALLWVLDENEALTRAIEWERADEIVEGDDHGTS